LTFTGPGNQLYTAPTVVKPKAKTPAQLRAEKLAKALKACKKEKNKGKRAKCEAKAHKSYGPLKKSKSSKKG
jgi:hypothetical protein